MSKNKNSTVVRFKKLVPGAELPSYATPEAAGMDIRSTGDFAIGSGQWVKVPTGLSAELSPGYELQVRSRSGLAAKFGVTVLNSPGTIDSDYRGEIQVLLVNHGQNTFFVSSGDRIAQLVLSRAPQAEIEEVQDLSSTSRGDGGFGSTGVS